MNESFVQSLPLTQFKLWGEIKPKRIPLSFDLEVTGRCNNNCRHCYINRPAEDKAAVSRELSFDQIQALADQAVSMGVLWCLITGGEPLLRPDFSDIYLYLKKKGLLVSVFTNATLLTEEHIELFQQFPPKSLEVTIYGISKDTYECVTRTPGSFAAFWKGVHLLLNAGLPVRLKAMALRSNFSEIKEILHFGRQKNKDYFRFDPFLHLRTDGNQSRNQEIVSERLLPEEIANLEYADPKRLIAIEKECGLPTAPASIATDPAPLFNCGAGHNSFSISCGGRFRLCSSLSAPTCTYDLKKGNLQDAWDNFVPRVIGMRSDDIKFLSRCHACPILNLCFWCPAHAHLETGKLDLPVDYFCRSAHARAALVKK